MSKRYLVRTYGCQMNEHDSERLAGLLEADGYEATDQVDEADVVVLNTCCIRENADNKLYGALGNLKVLKEAKPDLQIVVGGCLAQKDREQIQQRAGHVDVVLGTHNVHRATELMAEARENGPVLEIWEETVLDEQTLFPSALPVRRETDYAAWVTIQIGCDNNCAFCIVPAVRGKEISRPFDEIVDEVARLAKRGVTEITLLGQNVNSYGRDLAVAARKAGQDVRLRPQFDNLLRAVGAVDGIRRVRYISPHPKDMTQDVFDAMAETEAVMPHLHFPLQSGSNRILASMHRGYTSERFLEKVAAARATLPGVSITTDIIIGFPGETEEDFQRTLAVAAEAEFDAAFTFIYSPRPGTEAAEMTDAFVEPEVTKERYERLAAVVQRSSIRKHEAKIGRIEELLVEGPSKRDPAILNGRTRENQLVHFPSDPIKPGTYVNVKVTGATTRFLVGELVEVVDRAKHITRIPVTAASVSAASVTAAS
ncbi:MAG: tRNA (N6-isopentenyl adenosine(37)-C2)-methylthiotransferase MiaB [Acidimicrobiales bacterium]